MTIKEYLMQARRLLLRIKTDSDELRQLRQMAVLIGGLDYSRDRVQSSPKNGTEELVCRIVGLEGSIIHSIEGFLKLRDNIQAMLEGLPDAEYLVLQKRYLLAEKWGDIAEEMCYSERQIYKLHGRSLQKLGKEFSEIQY